MAQEKFVAVKINIKTIFNNSKNLNFNARQKKNKLRLCSGLILYIAIDYNMPSPIYLVKYKINISSST